MFPFPAFIVLMDWCVLKIVDVCQTPRQQREQPLTMAQKKVSINNRIPSWKPNTQKWYQRLMGLVCTSNFPNCHSHAALMLSSVKALVETATAFLSLCCLILFRALKVLFLVWEGLCWSELKTVIKQQITDREIHLSSF